MSRSLNDVQSPVRPDIRPDILESIIAIASNIVDFPPPLRPANTVNDGSKSIVSSTIPRKFSIFNLFIFIFVALKNNTAKIRFQSKKAALKNAPFYAHYQTSQPLGKLNRSQEISPLTFSSKKRRQCPIGKLRQDARAYQYL